MTNRIFLRVWEDEIDRMEEGDRIRVARDKPRRRSNGYAERIQHIDQMRNGAAVYGVHCKAVDPNTTDARTIESFDESTLLQLGELTNASCGTYTRIVVRVPVAGIARQRTGRSTLADDLKALVKKKNDSTTRDALVSARVGQGAFRAQVLAMCGSRCCVTGSYDR